MNDFNTAVRENMDAENFLCTECAEQALGYGKEYCEIHGNEFIDWKCKNCCSIALFVHGNGSNFHCQPCFNDMMEKRGDSPKTDCCGGPDCPLGVSCHPKAPKKYALGCSLCRSEKIDLIVKEAKGHGGLNVEKRSDMLSKHGHINNHDERNNYMR